MDERTIKSKAGCLVDVMRRRNGFVDIVVSGQDHIGGDFKLEFRRKFGNNRALDYASVMLKVQKMLVPLDMNLSHVASVEFTL